MTNSDDYLLLDDQKLLDQCDVHTYRSSGPGGQHRNKVSSAVRLHHRPTAITGHGDESRSQHDNKRMALRRLRMNIACKVRRAITPLETPLPAVVRECMFTPRGRPGAGLRLEVGVRDFRFWAVAACVLDLVDAYQGQLSSASAHLGITTGNLVSLLKSERHLFTAAQEIRKAHGQKPLT